MDSIELRYWKWYETRIADLFRRVKGAVVEANVKEIGQRSGTQRQIDIRVSLSLDINLGRGFSISIPIKIMIDCKAHNTVLDIKEIEEIIAFKEDVQANLAIVVSPKGVSDGALERAKADGVYPITVTGDLIALMHRLELPEKGCLICETGFVSWRNELEGYCDYCNGLHVRCPDCYEVIGIPSTQFDVGVQCGAQCGTVFKVTYNPKEMIHHTEVYDTLDCMLLTASYRKSTKRLTQLQVKKIVGQTRWQHWGEASPTIDLTELGLMKWEDDGCLHITEEGEQIVEDVIIEAEPSYFY